MGMTVKGYIPKRPSELLCAIAEQYEEREVDRWGREVRGGRGKRKNKEFFRVRWSHSPSPRNDKLTCSSFDIQAHLTWYGVEYYDEDTRDEDPEQYYEHSSASKTPR